MGELGKPKYKWEEQVSFKCNYKGTDETIDGVIRIVDANGTFEQNEEPSYDIEAVYDGEIILFKHIRESLVSARTESGFHVKAMKGM